MATAGAATGATAAVATAGAGAADPAPDRAGHHVLGMDRTWTPNWETKKGCSIQAIATKGL